MSPKARSNADELEPLLVQWELALKELAFFKLSPLIEKVLEIQRRHSPASELPCLRQLAIAELWELIDQTFTLPADFEVTAKRTIEAQIKRFKRSRDKRSSTVKKLKELREDVNLPLPSKELEYQEMQAILDLALQRLSREEARTLEMIYGFGNKNTLTPSAIAKLENVSLQTILNRERRAYRRLRRDERVRSLVS